MLGARHAISLLLLLMANRCGSLANELDRIRLKYEAQGAPQVVNTVPADGTLSAPSLASALVNYDRDIDGASISTNAFTGPCTGTVQVSFNNFASCLGIVATASGAQIRISGTAGANGNVPMGVTLKIRISGVTGTNGILAVAYESALGISFASPCGQNCFYSESAPLTGAVTNGSHSFIVPSGPNSGGVITFMGTTSNTTFFDPKTSQTSSGPASCCSIATGSHSFEVKTLGGPNSGKVITICGGGSALTCAYDPAGHSFAAGPAGLSGPFPSAGSFTVPIETGASSGQYVTFAGGSTAAYLYNVATNAYTPVGSVVAGATTIGPASSWVRLDSGGNAGKVFIVVGNGNTNTNLLTESTLSFASGTGTIAAINGGSFSFRANAGTHANRFIVAHGLTTQSSAYDQNVTMFAGPTLPCNPGTGASAITLNSGIRNGQTMVVCGGNSPAMAFYDHAANGFGALVSMTGLVGSNASVALLNSGTYAGKYYFVNGSATGNTSLYDPGQDLVVGSRLYRATGSGSSGFLIRSGQKLGRILIMTGGLPATSIYNPATALMEAGPDLPASIGAGASNIPVTSGANAGMQYILLGGGTSTIHKYNPTNNTFAAATGAGVDYSGTISAKNTGSRHFLIASGPKIDNYLFVSGGGTTTADLFDPATNTFSAVGGGVIGCASGVNAGSWVFRLGANAGANNGKSIVICGASFTTSVFDPAGPSFSGGVSIGGVTSPAAGAHGFFIPSGIHSGKFLFFPANNTTTTRMYDPAGNLWGPFPATLCAAAGAGAFSMPITQGTHAGKILVVLGGGSTNTCFFDPANNTFAAGPSTGGHNGYAVGADSLAFSLGYGLYPTAYVVIHGGVSTVFSHWFAY